MKHLHDEPELVDDECERCGEMAPVDDLRDVEVYPQTLMGPAEYELMCLTCRGTDDE